jgi:hypothetical protein
MFEALSDLAGFVFEGALPAPRTLELEQHVRLSRDPERRTATVVSRSKDGKFGQIEFADGERRFVSRHELFLVR